MLSLLGSLAIASGQLDINSYYTQSLRFRAFRGDSIATPAVSLEHGRGRLKNRSQARRPAMRNRGSLERAAASPTDQTPPTQDRATPQARGPIRHPMIRVVRLSVLCFYGTVGCNRFWACGVFSEADSEKYCGGFLEIGWEKLWV